jgi:hypothetical protein
MFLSAAAFPGHCGAVLSETAKGPHRPGANTAGREAALESHLDNGASPALSRAFDLPGQSLGEQKANVKHSWSRYLGKTPTMIIS